MTKPSWDETWLEVATTIAKRSVCSRAKVGAVIVDPGNRIVATGFNGPPRDFEADIGECDGSDGGPFCVRGKFGPTPATTMSYSDCPSIHGELNALMFCDRRDSEGGTIYVVGDVCYMCAKAIANSGLKRVVVRTDGTNRSYREPGSSYELLMASGLAVVVNGRRRVSFE